MPSKVTMPAASWPRCCSACRPSAVMRGGVGMAEDAEHAAFLAQACRRRGRARIACHAVFDFWPFGPPARKLSGRVPRVLSSNCSQPLPVGRLYPFAVVAFREPRRCIALGARAGSWRGRLGRVVVTRPLQALQDGGFRVVRQHGHQPVAGALQHHARAGVLDPVRLLLAGTSQAKNRKRDHHDQQAARQRRTGSRACGRARRCGCRGSRSEILTVMSETMSSVTRNTTADGDAVGDQVVARRTASRRAAVREKP